MEIIFGAEVGPFERNWGIFSLNLESGEINKIHEYKKGSQNSQGSKCQNSQIFFFFLCFLGYIFQIILTFFLGAQKNSVKNLSV